MNPGNPATWRRHPHAPAPGTELGPANAIPDGQGREFAFGPDHDRFRMFVVRSGSDLFGYLNVCPHFSLPLNYRPDQFTTRDGEILCSMHFDGACPGRALDPIPVEVAPDGTLRIAVG
jgi:nitrite reductase/ring-hydroxylating ferredoxin subunit